MDGPIEPEYIYWPTISGKAHIIEYIYLLNGPIDREHILVQY